MPHFEITYLNYNLDSDADGVTYTVLTSRAESNLSWCAAASGNSDKCENCMLNRQTDR